MKRVNWTPSFPLSCLLFPFLIWKLFQGWPLWGIVPALILSESHCHVLRPTLVPGIWKKPCAEWQSWESHPSPLSTALSDLLGECCSVEGLARSERSLHCKGLRKWFKVCEKWKKFRVLSFLLCYCCIKMPEVQSFNISISAVLIRYYTSPGKGLALPLSQSQTHIFKFPSDLPWPRQKSRTTQPTPRTVTWKPLGLRWFAYSKVWGGCTHFPQVKSKETSAEKHAELAGYLGLCLFSYSFILNSACPFVFKDLLAILLWTPPYPKTTSEGSWNPKTPQELSSI